MSESMTSRSGGFSRPIPENGPHEMQPSHDFIQYLTEYARAKPDVAALWCFGIGFVLGWKLKPW